MKKFLNFEPSDVDSLIVDKARRQLDEYFNGKRMEFDVPVNLIGTPFRESVWRSLLTITYGSTTSYSAFSRLMGRPGAVRAIANAIGANPLSIFLPCHRVVGADGSLTGYAGGLKAKKYLLELEQVNSIENRCLK